MRRGIVPFAFATVLTVAAGLSLAEEHAWRPATARQGAVTSSDLSAKGARPTAGGADLNPAAMSGPEHNGPRPAERRIGVGSRALTGHYGEPPADEQTR